MIPASQAVRRGVGLAFVAAVISGFSIFVNASGVKAVPDAALYTTGKNAIAAIVLLAGAMLLPGRVSWPAPTSRASAGLLLIAVIGGSVPFVLFFSGLAMATAPTAAFIQKTLFIWVALLAVPFLGERLGLVQVAALGVLLVGQALVAPPLNVGWGAGETMIAAATALWAVEVVVAKRLLGSVPVRTVAVARMGLGAVLLVGYLVVSGRIAQVGAVTQSGWMWMGITGLILAGYVATWFSALRFAPASVVTSVLVVGAVITGVLSTISTGATPSATVVGGYLLILASAVVLAGIAIRWSPRRLAGARAGA